MPQKRKTNDDIAVTISSGDGEHLVSMTPSELSEVADRLENGFAPLPETIYITQCKVGDEGRVEIHWLVARGGDLSSADKCEVKSNEKASNDYYFCLSKLRDFVTDILHLPSNYGSSITTAGIKLAWSSPNEKKPEEKIWSASINVEKHIPFCDEPWEFWTPMKPSKASRPDDQDRFAFPLEGARIVERLCDAAEKYIQGERAQMNLGEQE